MRSPTPTIAIFVFIALLASAQADGETGSEFDRVVAGFGRINTIAGRGFVNTCNGWFSTMEGGVATNAELSRPHMAQADAAGNVYIADKNSHAILMVKPDGTIHTVAGNGVRGNGGEGVATSISLREPNGLYTFPNGTTYIVELDDNCATGVPIPGGKIRRLGTDGMLTTVIDDPSLVGGRGIWVSPDESLIYYCSWKTVKKWTPDGGIEDFATGFGLLGNEGLGNIDIDPITGFLCVTDRADHKVYRLSADGSSRTVIAGNGFEGNGTHGGVATSSALEQVRGIAFRPDGSFFVCTHKGAHAVWFVDTAGRIWKLIDGGNNDHNGDGTLISAFTPNMISEPRAVALAPNGDLLITENDDGFIRRVTNVCVDHELTEFAPESGELTWKSHREASYTVQESRDLKNWTPVLNLSGSNGPTTTATVTPNDPRVYFRVVKNG